MNAPTSQFAYATIKEFEDIVGYTVGTAFRDGWRMARTTNAILGITPAKASMLERLESVSATLKELEADTRGPGRHEVYMGLHRAVASLAHSIHHEKKLPNE